MMAAPMATGQRPPIERHVPLDRRKNITFKGKLFYLDLPPNKHTQFLTKAICKMGGIIEGFLSRDVHYVVTRNRKALDNESSLGSRRGGHSKLKAAENIEPTLCRGKQLLKKVIQNQECSSVLANARSWGVCILHMDEVLDYIHHFTTEGNGAAGAGQTVKVAKLKCPYLKIEDHSRKYRPLQYCFSNFPELSFISSDRSPFETACTINSIHKEKDAADQEVEEQRSQRLNARERSGYCESCQEIFTKLAEHLISEKHSQFAQDNSNYKVIDDIARHITCDLMEFPNGNLPVSWRSVNDGSVSVEDAPVSVVQETKLEEDHTVRIVGEEYIPCLPPEPHKKKVDVSGHEQSVGMAVAIDTGGPAEDLNVQNQCNEPIQEVFETGAASHVNVVTEVSWYSEERGLTSICTLQSLVIPSGGQCAQPTTSPEAFPSPFHLPVAYPQSVDNLSKAYNLPGLGDKLPGDQITKTSGYRCSDVLVEQTTVTTVDDFIPEPSTICHLVDAVVPLPGGERRSEDIVDVQLNQQLSSNDKNEQLLQSIDGLHAQVSPQDQLMFTPVCEGTADILMVNPSPTVLANNSAKDDQNHLNVIPLYKVLADNSKIAHGTTALGIQSRAPLQSPLNVIPLHPGTGVMHSTTSMANIVGTPDQCQLQLTTNSCRGKRKHSWSSSPPPAKRQPYQYHPLSLPVWVFSHHSDSELNPAAHRFPDLKTEKTVRNEGAVDYCTSYFSPKLLQYNASSGSDWDLGLLSQQFCNQQQSVQVGDLCTAQVSLDESWYGRELCSVLTQDQSLGSLSTTQTVILTQTSYDLCLSGVAS